MIKQDDLIKFWKWSGFQTSNIGRRTIWYNPPSKKHPAYSGLPTLDYEMPRLTLDNLYCSAIPKLQDKGYIVKLVACEQKGFVVQLESCILMERVWEERADSPTEALFNAIMKVIDSEVK